MIKEEAFAYGVKQQGDYNIECCIYGVSHFVVEVLYNGLDTKMLVGIFGGECEVDFLEIY